MKLPSEVISASQFLSLDVWVWALNIRPQSSAVNTKIVLFLNVWVGIH